LAARFLVSALALWVLGAVVPSFDKAEPKYEVRLEKSVMVPMRDGVKLSTDLYFPEEAEEPLPTVLIRTPYNKKPGRREGSPTWFFAGQGYVVAVQDKRGKFESEGEYVVSGGDDRDGYDTVDWLAKQTWSNGKVGTYGCSYLGDVQIFQATLRNPHLAAMIPQASGSSIGSAGERYTYFGVRMGGALELAGGVGWFRQYGSKLYYRPPANTPHSELVETAEYFNPAPVLPEIDYKEIWWSLPVIDMMKKAGAPPTDWEPYYSLEPTDPWWDQFAYLTDEDRFDVPALFVNSWYDFGIADTLYQFGLFRRNAESARARDNQFVIISPTAHCASERATEKTIVGARDLGDARLDYWNIYLNWFDHWLKGIPNGVTSMPKVQYYVMGRNVWQSADSWPVPGTELTTYYLHSAGDANSRFGSGTLTPDPPGNEPSDRYTYDPATPVPSVGGPLCCTGTPDAPAGAFDQSGVEMRNDVLVFTTPELDEGIEVTGPLQAVLYVSSSARDTDFTVKLVDVYPDGTAFNVQEGILRARYREGFDKKVWMEPDGVYEVRIDLQATSNYFGPGHRVRLEVSSSNFPRFDRNLNTGGNNYDETEWVVARNTVHHSRRYPSHLVLPVVR
jgi:putative CocE/NonD family hydrolase